MNKAIAALAVVKPEAVGLQDFGRPGNYYARQIKRWSEGYRVSETEKIPEMDFLMDWLPKNIPAEDGLVCVVHGDYRLDNMIFHPTKPEILGVVDWELSTLGHPFADISYQCMQWRLTGDPEMRSLGDIDRTTLGIPSEEAYVAKFCERAGFAVDPQLGFLHRLQHVPLGRDHPGRLQARRRRQCVQPRQRLEARQDRADRRQAGQARGGGGGLRQSVATVRRFIQCDVFTDTPTKGNGLAVVVDSEGLSDADMQGFAAWTNLAETTFLQMPTQPEADYRVRIFTPSREMPFAGHPTLGSCAAWLHTGGKPKRPGAVMQECAVGLIEIRNDAKSSAFAAPSTTVAPLPAAKRDAITTALQIDAARIVDTAVLNNGPVWQVLELASADDVLAVDSSRIRYPEFAPVGLIGAHRPGAECQFEVRMLAPSSGMSEDPITGSLNAAIAHWRYGSGRWRDPVLVAQGTRIGRHGRVSIQRGSDGRVWVGGQTQILIEGTVVL